jgi:broad specificity phosphatase PhoE
MPRAAIQAEFPWACTFGAEFVDDAGVGWHRGGFERPAETDARIAGNRAWLLERARELPESDVVLLVAHGDTIARMLWAMLGVDGTVGHSIANTSISSLSVRPDGTVSLDFINRTPHLVGYADDRRNQEFYTFMGLKKRAVAKGKKQLDLSRHMASTSSDHKLLLAKL